MDSRLPLVVTTVVAAACAGHRPAASTAGRPTSVPNQVPAAAPTAPEAESVRFVAGNFRYRVDQSTHISQEIMGQVNEAELTARQILSAVASTAPGGLALSVTVDSIEASGPAGADPGLAAARGRTFRIVISTSGLFMSVESADSADALTQQFSAGLRDLFPVLPPDRGAAGSGWTDTVSTSRSGDASVATQSVRRHRVIGWEDRDGVRALHLETTSTYVVSGTTEAQGEAVELRGEGRSVSDAFVSAAGVFLGSVERDSAVINANVTSMGLNIPMRRSSRATVTRLP